MIKKTLLTTSVFSIIGIGISGMAYADDVNGIPASTYCKSGFYLGVQGGRTDSQYSPNEIFTPAANNGNGVTSSTTNPITSSFPGNSGSITINNSPVQTVTSITNNGLHAEEADDIGLGGRVYAGYQFMPYFAEELGFSQFAKSTFSATGIATTTINTASTYRTVLGSEALVNATNTFTTTTTQYTGEVTEHAIDLVAKGTLPLPYGFGLYAKAGMAYITANRDINSHITGSTSTGQSGQTTVINGTANSAISSNNADFSNVDTYSTVYSTTYQAFRPTAGAGLDYAIPYSNFDIEASYSRIFGSGAIDSVDLAALGINYKFA